MCCINNCCVHNYYECIDLIKLAYIGEVATIKNRKEFQPNLLRKNRIYIYNEEESKMIRFTDKRKWMPSRVISCFLTYNEANGNLIKKTFSILTQKGRYHLICYTDKNEDHLYACCENNKIHKEFLLEKITEISDNNLISFKDETKYRKKMHFKSRKPQLICLETIKNLKDDEQIMKYCFHDKDIKRSALFIEYFKRLENNTKQCKTNEETESPRDFDLISISPVDNFVDTCILATNNKIDQNDSFCDKNKRKLIIDEDSKNKRLFKQTNHNVK